ncbi:MAG: TadE/TadG family type IV pilus assembly protein [Lachnospiraceae bacterium]|nr:TadE/TadG family type IV pilus assembly protein [Lachnospiraceae bacterium]
MREKNRRRNRKSDQKGSFTVEASIIMPVIIIITVMLLYLGFFLYDRCIMDQKTYVAAFRGSIYDEELRDNTLDRKRYTEEELSHLYDKKILTGKGVTMDMQCDSKMVKVISGTKVTIPFATLLRNQGYENGWNIQVEKKAAILDEVDFIRSCRKLEKLGRE